MGQKMKLALALLIEVLTCGISTLLLFAFGTYDNQSSKPSSLAKWVFILGTLFAVDVALSYWV